MSNGTKENHSNKTPAKGNPKPKAMTKSQIDAVVCERMDAEITREVMSGLFVRNIARSCRITEEQAREAIGKRIEKVRGQLAT